MRVFRTFNDAILRDADNEGGAADDTVLEHDSGDSGDHGDSLDSGDAGGEGGEAPQKLSVRDEIKKAMRETSGEQQPPQEKAPPKKKAAKEAAPQGQQPQSQQPPTAQSAVPAPARLTGEAKAAWDKTPPAIQQAFVKAEQDMQRGVDELKQKYAGIDQALAPHQDALRQMNATPADAVNRMFLWFKALAGNPVAAFPELAKSMGMDWGKIQQAMGAQAQGQAPQGQQPQGQNQGAPAIPPELQQYVGGLEQHIRTLSQQMNELRNGYGTIQNDIQTQQMQKTEENLRLWSQGKEHFESVRQDMARLIQADPSLIKNGQVDLDAAYERAIYYNPEVRALVLAAQQQANQAATEQAQQAATTARQAQVATARKKAVSLPANSGPGPAGGQPSRKQQPQGKQSVGDSIRAAIAELRDQ